MSYINTAAVADVARLLEIFLRNMGDLWVLSSLGFRWFIKYE